MHVYEAHLGRTSTARRDALPIRVDGLPSTPFTVPLRRAHKPLRESR
jgi:hypothetical protein